MTRKIGNSSATEYSRAGNADPHVEEGDRKPDRMKSLAIVSIAWCRCHRSPTDEEADTEQENATTKSQAIASCQLRIWIAE